MSKLIIQGPGGEFSVEVKDGAHSMGRSSGCGIPLQDSNCSREHCQVLLQNGAWYVADMGSMNGTQVNGKKIAQPHKLIPGDRITIGLTHIHFEKVASQPGTRPNKPVQDKGPQTNVTTTPMRESDVRKAAAATATQQKKTERRKPTRSMQPIQGVAADYAVWTKDSGPWLSRLIITVVVIAVVGGLAVVGGGFLTGGKGKNDDPNNLLRSNPSFELEKDGVLLSWGIRDKKNSRISIDRTRARHRKACLLLDKSGEPSDLVIDVYYGSEVALDTTRSIDVSAWAQGEGFNGRVAIKVEWLTRVRGGALLYEEYSGLLSPSGDWRQLQYQFHAPAAAGAFRLALSAVGRKGRIFFDDVRTYAGTGGTVPAAHTFKDLTLIIGPSGAVSLGTRKGQLLSNAMFSLSSDTNGMIPQSFGQAKISKDGENNFTINGTVLNPVDLNPVDYEQTISHRDGSFVVGYSFPTGGDGQIDHIVARTTIPPGITVGGMPDEETGKTVLVGLPLNEGDISIEYLEPIMVRKGAAGGRSLLLQFFEPQDGKTVGFLMRRGEVGERKDPREAASQARRNGRPGESLDILRRYLPKVRDPRDRETIDKDIQNLLRLEQDAWSLAQSKAFRADTSQAEEDVNDAIETLQDFVRSWSGTEFASKADPLLTRLRTLLEDSRMRDRAARAKRLLEQAKQYIAMEWHHVARSLLEMVQNDFGETPSAEEAAQLAQSIEDKE